MQATKEKVFNYAKLRGRVKEKFGSQAAFAEAMGRNMATISLKFNNKVDWKADEIYDACKLLSIPLEEAPLYFFTA